jgi:hypothetical protein
MDGGRRCSLPDLKTGLRGRAHVRVWVTVMRSSLLLLLFLRGLGLGGVACRRCFPPCRRRRPASSRLV